MKPLDGFVLSEERIRRESGRGVWPNRVVTDYLDRWAAEKPQATALVVWELEAARAAAALEHSGVRAGDVVSFQLPNWWQFVVLYLATVRLGAVANPLMPIFRSRELSFMLRQAEPRVFVSPLRFRGFDHAALTRDLQKDLSKMHVLIAGGDGSDSFERALEAVQDAAAFERGARLRPNDITQLLYTSGTDR